MTEEQNKKALNKARTFSDNKDKIDGFYNGYIIGATENGIQWHDLRKDPNDLPKDRHNVYVVYLNGYNQIEKVIASFRHKYWVFNGLKTECKVVAWCELPKWELKENE